MKHLCFISILLLLSGNTHAQTVDWAAAIGSKHTDRALCVTIDNHGNKYIGGHFNDTVDFNLGVGSAIRICEVDGIGRGNAYVLKLDAADNFVKVLTFGSPTGANYIGVTAMSKDVSGNLFLSGYFNTTLDFDPDTAATHNVNPSGNAVFLLKLDANENFLWVKHWADNFDAGNANGTEEEGPAMVIDASGNVCFAGRYKETVDFDPGAGVFNLTSVGPQGYILKLDNNGSFVWAKNLVADTAGVDVVFPRSIAADASNNLYIAGEFIGTVDFNPDTVAAYNLTDSIQKGFLLKLAANGSFQWAKQMGGAGSSAISSFNYANAVAVDGASNVWLAGSFMGTVTMGTATLVSNGYSDIFIAKLDASGNYLWAKSIGNTWDSDMANRITVDAANNIYVAGTYRSSVDFDPGASVYSITSNGSNDAFLLKLNSGGGFEWAKSFGGSDYRELIYGVAVKDNSVYTVGRFLVQINCDNDGSYYIDAGYTGSGTERFEGWVAKINQGATAIDGVVDGSQFTIYPNPAANQFVIDLTDSKMSNSVVAIYDVQGKQVFETELEGTTAIVDAKDLHKGMYFIKIQTKIGHAIKKLVIE